MENPTITYTRYRTADLVIIYLAWLALLAYVFFTAWVAEDAYITFRIVDNAVAGYGLRWNIHERVQAYTHPLWMLLHIPLYAVWHNIFYVTISLGIVCTMAAVIMALAAQKKPALIALVFFFLPLALSKCFMDYSTSGLENPLSYLLFASFCYVLLKKSTSRYFGGWLSLTVALSMFNRLDAIVLYAPALLWTVYARWRDIRWGQMLLGALPLIGWLCFSLFYYGFLFPNTKYAKLNTGLDSWLYLREGLHYAEFFVVSDTLSAIIIVSTLVFCLPYFFPSRMKAFLQLGDASPAIQHLPAALALGVLWYSVYVIYIGGDYMAGRYWALPTFAATWLWYATIPAYVRLDKVFALVCAFAVAYAVPPLLVEMRKNCESCVVPRERLIDAHRIFSANSLVIRREFPPLHLRQEGRYQFANDGMKLAVKNPPPVKPLYFIGMAGFYAGPLPVLVDELGLADPLLARLPANPRQHIFIGHFRRHVPDGYLYALETGSLEHMDPALAAYYGKLKLITSGPLFNKQRLKTIVAFNLGLYDEFKYEYLQRHVH